MSNELNDAKVTFKVKKSTVLIWATGIAWVLVLISCGIVEVISG